MKREPVVLVMSILAGLYFFIGTVIVLIAEYTLIVKIAGIAGAAIAAVQFGIQFWVRGQVTPLAPDVAVQPPGVTVTSTPSREVN